MTRITRNIFSLGYTLFFYSSKEILFKGYLDKDNEDLARRAQRAKFLEWQREEARKKVFISFFLTSFVYQKEMAPVVAKQPIDGQVLKPVISENVAVAADCLAQKNVVNAPHLIQTKCSYADIAKKNLTVLINLTFLFSIAIKFKFHK